MAPVYAKDGPSTGQPDTTSPMSDGQNSNGRKGNDRPSESSDYALRHGIGFGVGGALLIAIIFMLVAIYKRRAQHRREIAMLNHASGGTRTTPGMAIAEVPRPASYAQQGSLNPLQSKAGWGALSSNENLHHDPALGKRLSQVFSLGGSNKKRNPVTLPKRVRHRGIPLRRLKHLSSITESPRNRVERSPSPTAQEAGANMQDTPMSMRTPTAMSHSVPEDSDVFVCPSSPKAETVPSFAIGIAKLRQPTAAATGIAGIKAVRSKSLGTVLADMPDSVVFGGTGGLSRPSMRARSFSWGVQAVSRPPSGPVPPLPVISPPRADNIDTSRQGLCVRRQSSNSSRESTGSSVLVCSPLLAMRKDKPAASPSAEQLVADDEEAELRTVDKQRHENSVLASSHSAPSMRRDGAVKSAMAHYSDYGRVSARLSSASTASSILSSRNRLSITQVRTTDRVSISRVSSSGSLNSSPGVTKFASIPVRKPSRPVSTTVSIDGSPAQRRKKKHVLRSISGNAAHTPSRQPSDSTQGSGTSSYGNPFQWDGHMQVCHQPSALKGSPNARKGHRRQNCVRISTLTPQILGPPPSGPTSPSLMDGIEEEGTDEKDVGRQKRSVGFTSNKQRPSRPLSTTNFAPHPHITSLRASLTPSSPTLSTWIEYHEPDGLPSQPSEGTLSAPSPNKAKRYSDQSSALSLLSFPSPSKATVSMVQNDQPVLEFFLSRPSTDIYYSSDKENMGSSPPPFGEYSWHREHQEYIPSSPPLPSNSKAYDPAWPIVTVPAPQTNLGYDPASPALHYSSPSQYASSPPALHFATARSPESAISPRSRPVSQVGGETPDTPPCSPKTMPEGFEDFFQKKRQSTALSKITKASGPSQQEKLTSSNASAIMAQLPPRQASINSNLDAFPGAPILPPPSESAPQAPPKSAARAQRAASISLNPQTYLKPLRTAPPPPPPLPSIRVHSPLHIPNKPQQPRSPLDPRSEPAKSVLKNAMALRRMNSDIDCTTCDSSPDETSYRGSNRYLRLGREASLLLPFIAGQETEGLGVEASDVSDLKFGAAMASDAYAGADDEEDVNGKFRRGRSGSTLDDIDFQALEWKISRVLAEFDASAEVEVETGVGDELLPTVVEERSSSVWEDGQRHWEWLELKKQRESRGSSVGSEAGYGGGRLAAVGARVSKGRYMAPPLTPVEKRLRGQSSPGGATHWSLYDADGFLREDPGVQRR